MALFSTATPKPINYTNPVAAKIQQRRLQLLVHAYLYYELDSPVISDEKWNKWAKELYDLQKSNPVLATSKKIPYSTEFAGFDPSTGFDLEYNKPEVQKRAERLLKWTHQN